MSDPGENQKAKRAPKSPDSKPVDIDYGRIIDGVVQQLKPEMEKYFNSAITPLKIEIQDLRKATPQPQIAQPQQQQGGIDLQGIMREAEKQFPGLSGMLGQIKPQQQQQPVMGGGIQNGAMLPPSGDIFAYAAAMEQGFNQPQQQQGQGQQQPGMAGNPLMLIELLKQLGVIGQPAAGGVPGVFMEALMRDKLGDLSLGSLIRKQFYMNLAKQNPILGQEGMTIEEQLFGKQLKQAAGIIPIPDPNNPQQGQGGQPAQ